MSTVGTEQRSLAALVRRRNDEGWSYREMEKRARDRGYVIAHSQLADYANDTVSKMPSKDQIEALAAALDVGVDVVRAAALDQFWDYIPRELKSRKGSRLTAVVPSDLSQAEEEELLRMVEAWLAARRRNP